MATVGFATSETIEISQTSTAEGRPARAETPATVEVPTIVLALAGTPIPTTHDVPGKFAKKLSER